MEFEEISKKAYLKSGIEKFWDLPTKYAYNQLEELYFKYSLGNINKESSIEQKNKIKKEYESNKIEYNKSLDIQKEYNKNRIDNYSLLTEIEKAKNKSEIFEPAFKIIANYVKDDSFVERNMQKITKLDF